MILRTLHPRRELPLFRLAWGWRSRYPSRVRRWDMVTNFEQWMGMMLNRVSIGVFDPWLTALVTLEPTGDGIYEVHVDCERRANKESLLTALLNIRKVVFEEWGASEIFAGVISRNYGIIGIAQACGFTPDGIEEQVGQLRFIRLRMTREEYVFDQNEHLNGIDYEPVSADAGCGISRYRSVETATVSG